MLYRSTSVITLLILCGLLLTGCADIVQALNSTEVATVTPVAQKSEPADSVREDPSPVPTEMEPEPATDTPEPDDLAVTVPQTSVIPTFDPADKPPRGAIQEFKTDFSIHSVPYNEILSGGPPKDGIPPIDDPKYVSISEADEWLEPVDPVIHVQVGDVARAYPLEILTWHEIVNDTLGELPLVVTFCPLCNTGIAFLRTFDDRVLDFGTTGRLRFSNLVMYDRQTETWWQQASGEAIAGELTGSQLEFYPAATISWETFRSSFPDGDVLSRVTGHNRPYGQNPYAGYDDVSRSPFLYLGPETPDKLPSMAIVLTVDLGQEAVAYHNNILADLKVINDTVAGQEIVAFWIEGTASALDKSTISAGRDVGSGNTFLRLLGDQLLTFRSEDDRIFDDQTDSEWNLLGRAIEGELAGEQLEPIVSINHFWFSWAAFKPETRIYQP
jgi:hypothetical protein